MEMHEAIGCATDVFALVDIQEALRRAGAKNVRARRAFGWSNQPRVATYSAESESAARRIADRARETLRPGSLPALIPYRYGAAA